MCLQASRFDSRIDGDGEIVLLKDQDRSTWNKKLIEKGFMYLKKSDIGYERSEYQLEASIAACHAMAADFEQTNWSTIYSLYSELAILRPGPVVEMNRAIAKGYSISPFEGLALLLAVEGLESNHFYHTAVGDFYKELKQYNKARMAYDRALELTPSKKQRTLMRRKIEAMKS
jgi:RNA polymerase sigma-70 factor (ECF subfamily)